MQNMRALQSMTYATRHLVAGDPFQCDPAHVRALTATKKAQPVDDAGQALPAPEKPKSERPKARPAQEKRGRGRPPGAKNRPKG